MKDDLIKNLCSGLGIDEMWKTLADLDVQQAKAYVAKDKDAIMSIIEKSPKMDFHSVNSAVSNYLQTWIVHTCEEHLHTMLKKSSTTAMEKVMLRLNVGSLLRKIGRDDMSDRAAKYLSAASEARKGTNGVSTNGVTANKFYDLFDGTSWYQSINICQKLSMSRTFFPQSVKVHYFCSGPVSFDPICPRPRGADEA